MIRSYSLHDHDRISLFCRHVISPFSLRVLTMAASLFLVLVLLSFASSSAILARPFLADTVPSVGRY